MESLRQAENDFKIIKQGTLTAAVLLLQMFYLKFLELYLKSQLERVAQLLD